MTSLKFNNGKNRRNKKQIYDRFTKEIKISGQNLKISKSQPDFKRYVSPFLYAMLILVLSKETLINCGFSVGWLSSFMICFK